MKNVLHRSSASGFRLLNVLSMVYCTLLIVSVLFPYKIINFFGLSQPGGIFVFPLTYLLAGAMAETYGRNITLRIIYSSVFCLMLFNTLTYIIVHIPSVPDATNQDVFLQAFGHGIRLSIGCLAGLICSDLTNVYRITKLKLIFRGKYFIQRLIWSTALSEAIFNLTTYSITYSGILASEKIFKLMVYSWILKMVYSVMMVIPLLWLMNAIKKIEGVDILDVNSNSLHKLNPEKLFIKLTKIDTFQKELQKAQ